MFRCFINIQKDANERKLTQVGRTNVAIYTCTKFVLRFVYVDANNSVRSWQILYVNHVLWCFINIQKDANEQKLTQAGRTNVAIYMCTKFVLRFVYVDTNNSVRSWQILYVNHVLWYVNGNAAQVCNHKI